MLQEHETDGPVTMADPKAFQEHLRAKAQASATDQQAERAKQRAKLKGRKADDDKTRYNADINAILSKDYDGLTLGHLAVGWYWRDTSSLHNEPVGPFDTKDAAIKNSKVGT